MTPRTIKRRWLVAAIAVIVAATLTPTRETIEGEIFCIVCGERGLADATVNLLLFLPLGAALAGRRFSLRQSALIGCCLSLSVELLQFIVPGRETTLNDLVFNTVGTVAGFTLARKYWQRDGAPDARSSALYAVLAAQLLLLGFAGFLFEPALLPTIYFGQWAPEFGNLAHYSGTITRVRVGTLAIGDGQLARPLDVRDSLHAGATLSIDAIAGAKTASFAPIFNIFDHIHREMISIGADRNDLVLRYRSRSVALRLDQPSLRLSGFLRGVRAGDQLNLRVTRTARGFCVQRASVHACPRGFDLGDTWQLVVNADRLPRPFASVLRYAWLLLFFTPTGFWLWPRTNAAILVTSVAAALLVLPVPLWLMPTPYYQIGSALAGLMAGAALQRWLSSRRGAPRAGGQICSTGNTAPSKFDRQRSIRS